MFGDTSNQVHGGKQVNVNKERSKGNKQRTKQTTNSTVKESIDSTSTSVNRNEGAKSTTTGEKGKGNKQRGKKSIKTTDTRFLQKSLFQPSIEDDTIMERCIACEDSLSSISLE